MLITLPECLMPGARPGVSRDASRRPVLLIVNIIHKLRSKSAQTGTLRCAKHITHTMNRDKMKSGTVLQYHFASRSSTATGSTSMHNENQLN